MARKVENPAKTEYGKKLRSLREQLGWDQTKLAEVWGTSRWTISRWEEGTQKIHGPTKVLIEIYLDWLSRHKKGRLRPTSKYI